MLDKIMPSKKEKLALEIPLSVIQLANKKPAIQLKKIIIDPENIGYFIKNCLKDDHIEAKIIFKDKFKAKIRLHELGYKIEE